MGCHFLYLTDEHFEWSLFTDLEIYQQVCVCMCARLLACLRACVRACVCFIVV